MIRQRTIGVFVGALVLAIATQAAALTVINPGFEDPSQSDGGFTIGGIITGWSAVPDAGVFDPTAAQVLVVPEGKQVGYSNGGPIFQILSDVLTANTDYALAVDALRRIDGCCGNPIFTIELLAGTTVLDSESLDYTLLAPGAIVTLVANFSTGDAHPDLGQALAIRLTSEGAQSDFDNVRLEAREQTPTGVPEPASMLVLGSGLVGLAASMVRKRRK